MSHVDPLAHGMYQGHSDKMSRKAVAAHQNAEKAWREVGRVKDISNSNMAHYIAKEAEAEYLLELLDEAHGGPENNPARKPAYGADTKLRIPCGKRKGEIPQVRDHVFYTAMKERFDDPSKGLKGVWKNWFDVIRLRGIFE